MKFTNFRQNISRYFLELWLEWIIWIMILLIVLGITHFWKISSNEVEIDVTAERVEWVTGPILNTSILENCHFQQVDIKNFADVKFKGKQLPNQANDSGYTILPSGNKIYGSAIRLEKPHDSNNLPTNKSPVGTLDGIVLQEKYKVILEIIGNDNLRVEVSPPPASPAWRVNLSITDRFQLVIAPQHSLRSDSHDQSNENEQRSDNEWRGDFELSKDNRYIKIQGQPELLQLNLGVLSEPTLELYQENVGEGISITALRFFRQSGDGIKSTLTDGKITYPRSEKPEKSIDPLDLLVVEPNLEKQGIKIRKITLDNNKIHLNMRGNAKRIGTSRLTNTKALDEDYRLTAYDKIGYLWQAMTLIGSLPLVVMVSRLRRGQHKT